MASSLPDDLQDRIVPYLMDGDAANPVKLGATSVLPHQYVGDVDAAVARAVEAGATLVREPADQFYGDRAALLADPFGHLWSLRTHLRGRTGEWGGTARNEQSGCLTPSVLVWVRRPWGCRNRACCWPGPPDRGRRSAGRGRPGP